MRIAAIMLILSSAPASAGNLQAACGALAQFMVAEAEMNMEIALAVHAYVRTMQVVADVRDGEGYDVAATMAGEIFDRVEAIILDRTRERSEAIDQATPYCRP